jgi:hypothetical protein
MYTALAVEASIKKRVYMGIFSTYRLIKKMGRTSAFIEETYETKCAYRGVISNLISTLVRDFSSTHSTEEIATMVVYFYTGFYLYGDVNPENEGILNMPDKIIFWSRVADNLKVSGKIYDDSAASGCVRYLKLMANGDLIEDIVDISVLKAFLGFKKDFFTAYPKN